MKNKSKLTKGFVWTVFTIALLLLLSLQAGRAQAATFVVNSTADAVDAAPGNGSCATAAGVCTLRAAIQETNALPGADTITLPAGTYMLTIPGVNEAYSATGDLDIISDLTITGAGANMTTVDAGGIDRVLEIRTGTTTNVLISGLTVTGGKNLALAPGVLGAGGGIHTQGGLLTLTNVTVSGNTAGSQGGGISKAGPLILNNCTVSNNTAGYEPGTPGGGGIMDYINGPLTLNNSTVSGNTSPYGGGIGSSNYPLDISMTNSTVSNNTGGGLQVRHGRVTMKNTIMANGGFNCYFSGYGPAALVSLGHNLSTDNSCAAPIVNVTGGLDPAKGDFNKTPAQLAPLALNLPGSTTTHALCAGPGAPVTTCLAASPAIDKGNDCLAVDQRGVPRPQGAACDIGAYEVGTVQDTIPPETTIASVVDENALVVASGGSTLSGSTTLTFGGTDAVGVTGFQCSLDGAAYGPCVSPVSYSALAISSHTFQVRAIDAAGNVDASPASFTWTVLTPAQAIENLITTIGNMGLPGGVATSLTAPLSNINTNNKAAACAKLNAFINQVNTKLQNGQLTSAQGSQLLQAANAIIASLGC